MTKLLAMALLIAACGGATPAPQAVPPSTPRDAAAVVAPSDADCAALLDHAIALAAASHPATTDAERAQLRAELEPDFTPKCRAMTIAQARCARDAATPAAFAACDSAQPQ